MTPKFQIFLSSTFEDLKDARRIVMEQILNLGHIPVGMELFQAGNNSQWDYIKNRIMECDYYLLVVGDRYGSCLPDGMSYTEREYRFAIEQSVPVASFLLGKEARLKLPKTNIETDQAKAERLEQFRELVQTRMVQYWSEHYELAAKISSALPSLIRDFPRPGLVPPGSLLPAPDAKGGFREGVGQTQAPAEEPVENLPAGTWTLATTYLRNLILNWRMLISLLATVLTIPWIYLAVLMTYPPPYTFFPLWPGVGCIILGVAYSNLPSAGKTRSGQKKFLLLCLLPLFLGAILMTMFWAWFTFYGGQTPYWPFWPGRERYTLPPFICLGIGVHLIAWIISVLRHPGFRPLEFLAVIATGAIGGTLLWVVSLKLFPQPLAVAELYVCFAIPLFFGILVAFMGLSGRWTSDEGGEWWGGVKGWLLMLAVGWSVVSGLAVFGPWSLSETTSAVVAAIAGAFTLLVPPSRSIPANGKQREEAGPVALILSKISGIAAVIFIAMLVILIVRLVTFAVSVIAPHLGVAWNLDAKSYVLGGRTVEYINVLLYTPWWLVLAVAITLAAIGLLVGPRSAPRRRAAASGPGDDPQGGALASD